MIDELKKNNIDVDTFVVDTKRNGIVNEHVEENLHIFELTN